MNLEEILHDTRFRLPLTKDAKIDFLAYLTAHFNDYIEELKQDINLLSAYPVQGMLTDNFIATTREIADDVIHILRLRLGGDLGWVRKFEEFMERMTWAMMIPQTYIANMPKGSITIAALPDL